MNYINYSYILNLPTILILMTKCGSCAQQTIRKALGFTLHCSELDSYENQHLIE